MAGEFADAIRSVLRGDCAGYSKEYSCNSPDKLRWFIGRVTRFLSNSLPRAIVEHINITERKCAEQLLRESEERFRTMADGCPSLMWVTGAEGEVEFINRAYQKFFSTTREEVQSGRWHLLVHPDDAPAYIEAFDRAVKEHTSFSAEARVRQADGQWRLLGSKAEPRISPGGEYMGLVGLSADITERRHAEQALQASEEKLRQIAENIKEVFWMMNAAGTETLYVSPAYEQIWGRTCESLYKDPMDWKNAIHPNDREGAHEIFMKQMQGESIDSEYRIRTPDGQEKWICDRAFPIRDEAGQLIRIAGIAAEITERKLTETLLKQTADRLMLATRAGDVGVWDWDITNDVMVWDEQMFRLYGIEEGQFRHAPGAWKKKLHPEDRERALEECRAALSGEKSFDTEIRVVRPDGSIRSVKALAQVERDGNGKPLRMIGTNWDITAQKQTADALLASNLQLQKETQRANNLAIEAEKATVAKSQFLANMSHEIRTPMNGVIGMNQLLLETELTPEQRGYVEVAQDSGRTLLSLIDEILDLSKIEAGKITLEDADFCLKHTVEEMLEPLRIQAGAKGLQMVSRFSPDIPESLRGDAQRLRQVLTNLIGNAIKFTDQGEISVEAKLDSRSENAASIRFTVTDTGIGIPEDRIPALFSPFVQADASTTRKYGGTGLGLAISKQLVEMMGGTIGVSSWLGRGSTFRFTANFGRVVAAQDQSTAKPGFFKQQKSIDPAANALPRGHGELVLIAEDNPTNQQVILAQLKKLGYEAKVAANGVEAVEAVEREKFDLVLMDCQMPLMDGYEATRRIRQSIHPPIPIIALTANAMNPDRARCLREGMDEYLAKPVELRDLATVIAKWISKPSAGNMLPILKPPPDGPAATIFNGDSVLRRLMGDRDLAGAVLRGFLEDAPSQLKRLCARLDEADASGTRLQAHTLKGAAATVGAEVLRALALAIETDASEGRLERCPELLVRAIDEFECFKQTLEHDGWVSKTFDNTGIEETSDV